MRVRVLAKVTGVNGATVSFAEGFAGEPAETTADLVVVRTRMRANDGLIRELEGAGPALATIGDASAPRRLNHAVLDANLAIKRFDEGSLGADCDGARLARYRIDGRTIAPSPSIDRVRSAITALYSGCVRTQNRSVEWPR